MEKTITEMACEYAETIGKDSIRSAGNKNGYEYFHVFLKANLGHKLGLPHIVKINKEGVLVRVNNISEIMWAVKQEVILNNL